MTWRVLKGAVEIASGLADFAACVAATPNPLDDDYTWEDEPPGMGVNTYTVNGFGLNLTSAGWALTIRGASTAQRPSIDCTASAHYTAGIWVQSAMTGVVRFEAVEFTHWSGHTGVGGAVYADFNGAAPAEPQLHFVDCIFTYDAAGARYAVEIGRWPAQSLTCGTEFLRCTWNCPSGQSGNIFASKYAASVTFTECVIGQPGGGLPGGISLRAERLTLSRCAFYLNGTLGTLRDVADVQNCLFWQPQEGGAGLFLFDGGNAFDHVFLFNTFVLKSRPGGSGTVPISAINYQSAGAGGSLTAKNNIFAVNNSTVGSGSVRAFWTTAASVAVLNLDHNLYFRESSGGDAWLNYGTTNASDLATWQGLQSGSADANSVEGDPLFVDYAAGDLHLDGASPAVGLALDVGISVDLDNVARPQDATFDAGAYEFLNPAVTTYLMRAWDDGTMGFVYWTNADPTAAPLPGDTTPNYTGALSATSVQRVYIVPSPAASYLMRAWDDGTMGFVYWTNADPTVVPLPGDTTPNYTGALSATSVQSEA